MHSAAKLEKWLDRILEHEGGFSIDPEDPGNWTGGAVDAGELKGTKFGIAANTHGWYLDIENLTIDQAIAIYREEYLDPIKVDDLRDGPAYQLFDFGVNSGPSRAKKDLQTAIGVVSDGIIGPITLKAMRALKEHQLIMRLLAQRLKFLCMRSTWGVHGKGWARRIAQNLIYGAEDS